MNKSPTIGQVLGLLSVIIIPLLVWGISVETRFTASLIRIQQNESQNAKMYTKIDRIETATTNILIQIERIKKNTE